MCELPTDIYARKKNSFHQDPEFRKFFTGDGDGPTEGGGSNENKNEFGSESDLMTALESGGNDHYTGIYFFPRSKPGKAVVGFLGRQFLVGVKNILSKDKTVYEFSNSELGDRVIHAIDPDDPYAGQIINLDPPSSPTSLFPDDFLPNGCSIIKKQTLLHGSTPEHISTGTSVIDALEKETWSPATIRFTGSELLEKRLNDMQEGSSLKSLQGFSTNITITGVGSTSDMSVPASICFVNVNPDIDMGYSFYFDFNDTELDGYYLNYFCGEWNVYSKEE